MNCGSRLDSVKRYLMVIVCFVVCLTTFITIAHAEQPVSDSSRFVGTWALVSLETRWPDGHVTARWVLTRPGA